MQPFSINLYNAVDEALLRRRKSGSSDVHSCTVLAVVDSKSAWTVIPKSVADRLGLTIRTHRIKRPSGEIDTLVKADHVRIEILGRDSVEDVKLGGKIVKIGFTTLAKLDLVFDSEKQQVITIPKHPDGPVFHV